MDQQKNDSKPTLVQREGGTDSGPASDHSVSRAGPPPPPPPRGRRGTTLTSPGARGAKFKLQKPCVRGSRIARGSFAAAAAAEER